jgi:hypothetical protein
MLVFLKEKPEEATVDNEENEYKETMLSNEPIDGETNE